jgi:hypothetical protein
MLWVRVPIMGVCKSIMEIGGLRYEIVENDLKIILRKNGRRKET